MPAIPLNLISGFLGSGKTTFLLHYLDHFSAQRKIAVIQNEFSSVGIDGRLVEHHGGAYRILEVNNGSVFCVCLLGSFVDSLRVFIDDNSPDEIIMEASGMSDPVSIGQIFQSPKLQTRVYLGHSWTLVDARNFYKVKALRNRLEHQIRIADTVIINKSDLAEEEAEQLRVKIKKINPWAVLVKTSFAKVVFEDTEAAVRFSPVMPGTETSRPDLKSFVIKSSKLITPEKLKDFLEYVKPMFIRLKGYVNTGKNRKSVIQLTFEEYTIAETEWFAGVTELVGIAHNEPGEDLTRRFEKYCIQ
jgi:G3E family GTPase